MTVQLPAATSCASPIQRDTKANTQAAQKDATATVYSMIRGCFIFGENLWSFRTTPAAEAAGVDRELDIIAPILGFEYPRSSKDNLHQNQILLPNNQ